MLDLYVGCKWKNSVLSPTCGCFLYFDLFYFLYSVISAVFLSCIGGKILTSVLVVVVTFVNLSIYMLSLLW
jgi:hypothetical protein